MGECAYTPPDPVHRHDDGTWWFWDETWCDEMGPYDHEDEANLVLRMYGHWLETGNVCYYGDTSRPWTRLTLRRTFTLQAVSPVP